MQSLDERLTELRAKAAGDFEHEAMVIEAEIRGIEAALAVRKVLEVLRKEVAG